MSKIKLLWLKLKPKLKNKKLLAAIAAIIIILVFIFASGKEDTSNSFKVVRSEMVKSVSVSGKIVSQNDVDLAFETGGTVSAVYLKTGDSVVAGQSIATLRSGELAASRDKAQAALEEQEAELMKLKAGKGSDTEVSSNKRLVVNSIIDAWTNADDAIHNKVDQFFDHPKSTTAQIRYRFDNYSSTVDNINDGREAVELVLNSFEIEVEGLSESSYKQSDFDNAYRSLIAVKRFLDLVSPAVNSFEIDDDLTQVAIDKYKSDIALARANINESLSSLTSITENLRSSVSDIPVQEARVKAAAAEVRNLDSQLAKTVLRAPFSGVLSLQDAEVGESVSANEHLVSIITSAVLIEAYVPEVSIAGVALGNEAEITLDAYPDEVFRAKVSHIDPSETERDGVSNYKIKLILEIEDSRMLPGMTVDVRIFIGRKPGVLVIPERSILKEDGKSFVMVQGEKENIKREITVGERDGRGNIEVLSALEVGENIALDPAVK